MLVTSLDQFLKQKPAGKIVGLIDRTVGADAVVLNTRQYPQLKSLLDLNQMVKQSQGQQKVMTFAGDTPSEYLGQVLAAKFDAFKLSDFEVVKVEDASEAWKKMQDPQQNVAIAVLWEPFVTRAQQQGNTVVLSSRDTPNTIVDVLVASDQLIQSRPKAISQFFDAYYRRIDTALQDNSQLKTEIAEDGKLSANEAGSVLKGINFFTSLEAQRWLRNGTLEQQIGATAAVLTLAGKLDQVPAQPKTLFSDRFMQGAVANTQALIELVGANDPQLAMKLSRTQSSDSDGPPNTAQGKAASNIGNLALRGQVGFETGSSQLTDGGKKTLDQLQQEIGTFNAQTVAVQIIGHTSKIGSSDLNQDLSQQRAEIVADYLRASGLKHKITALGKGFSQPLEKIAPGDVRNQRTEIRLVRIN